MITDVGKAVKPDPLGLSPGVDKFLEPGTIAAMKHRELTTRARRPHHDVQACLGAERPGFLTQPLANVTAMLEAGTWEKGELAWASGHISLISEG